MSVFGTLVSKIFGRDDAAKPAAAPTTPAATTATPAATAPYVMAAPSAQRAEDVLRELAAKSSQTLDWEHSIVDLMKLVHMDSSLATRKELAQELGYTGDMNDSASMNIWLHAKVMENLSQDGGRVAANLLNGA